MKFRLPRRAKTPTFVNYNYPYDSHIYIYQHRLNAYSEFAVLGHKRISCGVHFDITTGYRWKVFKLKLHWHKLMFC